MIRHSDQVYKVETAGDCYIVAGALMSVDEDGFMALEMDPDARRGAESVMEFSKVDCLIQTFQTSISDITVVVVIS